MTRDPTTRPVTRSDIRATVWDVIFDHVSEAQLMLALRMLARLDQAEAGDGAAIAWVEDQLQHGEVRINADGSRELVRKVRP